MNLKKKKAENVGNLLSTVENLDEWLVGLVILPSLQCEIQFIGPRSTKARQQHIRESTQTKHLLRNTVSPVDGG